MFIILYNCSFVFNYNFWRKKWKMNKIPHFMNNILHEQISIVTKKINMVNVSYCPHYTIYIVHWLTLKYEKCDSLSHIFQHTEYWKLKMHVIFINYNNNSPVYPNFRKKSGASLKIFSPTFLWISFLYKTFIILYNCS